MVKQPRDSDQPTNKTRQKATAKLTDITRLLSAQCMHDDFWTKLKVAIFKKVGGDQPETINFVTTMAFGGYSGPYP